MAQGWRRDYSRYKGFFLNILNIYKSKPTLIVYLEIILSLTTIIVFSIFAIKPTVLTIIELNNEIGNKESVIVSLNQKIGNLKTASSVLQNQSSRLNLIDQAVPKSANLETVIDQVEKLAATHQVGILNIASTDLFLSGASSKKAKAGDLKALPGEVNELNLTISVTGSYQDLLNFLKSIENLRRPIKIDTFVINATNSSDSTRVIVLTLTGRLPFINQSKI